MTAFELANDLVVHLYRSRRSRGSKWYDPLQRDIGHLNVWNQSTYVRAAHKCGVIVLMLSQADPTLQMPGPSMTVVLVMIVMLVASVWVYAQLTHLWTTRRPLAAMQEWARANGMRICQPSQVELPAVIGQVGDGLRVTRVLKNEVTTIVQVESAGARWHLMVRDLPGAKATEAVQPAWPATGLRPADREVPWMESMTRRSFPTLLPPERFVVVGTERGAAEALAASSVRALLPADVAVMVVGHSMLLEFSPRPFDGVEFSRLLAVMDQVVEALPVLVFEREPDR